MLHAGAMKHGTRYPCVMPQSLGEYFDSKLRRVGYVALELSLALVSVAIAWFIVPALRGGDHEIPRLADALLQTYPLIVVAFLIHAGATAVVIPRLRTRGVAIWVLSGMFLTVMLIMVPFIAYTFVYGSLFDGLQ